MADPSEVNPADPVEALRWIRDEIEGGCWDDYERQQGRCYESHPDNPRSWCAWCTATIALAALAALPAPPPDRVPEGAP